MRVALEALNAFDGSRRDERDPCRNPERCDGPAREVAGRCGRRPGRRAGRGRRGPHHVGGLRLRDPERERWADATSYRYEAARKLRAAVHYARRALNTKGRP